MRFRLKNSDNIIKYEMAPFIERFFPNYERFYSSFIIQLIGHDGNWKIDMHPILEEIGMCDYAVLKSLNYIRRSKLFVIVGDPNQTFKNIYFHFGLILDAVEHMGRHILRLEQELNLIDLNSKLRQSECEIRQQLERWIINEYQGQFQEFIKTGKPITPSVKKPAIMKLLIHDNNLMRKYNAFSREIREYRNVFVHNPSVDIVLVKRRAEISVALVSPVKNKVREYPLWNDIRTKFESHPKDFVDSRSLIENDFHNLLRILNEIWEVYHKRMQGIFQESNIDSYLNNFQRS